MATQDDIDHILHHLNAVATSHAGQMAITGLCDEATALIVGAGTIDGCVLDFLAANGSAELQAIVSVSQGARDGDGHQACVHALHLAIEGEL